MVDSKLKYSDSLEKLEWFKEKSSSTLQAFEEAERGRVDPDEARGERAAGGVAKFFAYWDEKPASEKVLSFQV